MPPLERSPSAQPCSSVSWEQNGYFAAQEFLRVSEENLRRIQESFPSGFPTKILYVFLFFPTSATCPAHLILIDLISWKIFSEEHISGSASLCNFLQSPVTPSLLGMKVFLSTRSFSCNSLKIDMGSFNRKLQDNAQFCTHPFTRRPSLHNALTKDLGYNSF